MLWLVWGEKQKQLNEALEQHAELSAVVFDHWLDAQYQPLRTVASYQQGRPQERAAITEVLKAARNNRTHWIDVRVLDANAKVVAIDPADAGDLPSGVAEKLLSATKRNLPDLETDWTRGEGRYLLALSVPVQDGSAVVARIDGAALTEPLQGLILPERALITLLDRNHRVIYRSQTAESALGLAEVDRLKSEFVSTVSHEMRTPLTTIKALTRLLMREGLDENNGASISLCNQVRVACGRKAKS